MPAHDGSAPRADRPTPATTAAATAETVFVAYDGIQSLDLTGPLEVFHGANRVLAGRGRAPGYRVGVVSAGGSPVRTESGLEIATQPATGRRVHTVVVPGGRGAERAADEPATVELVRRLGERAERVVTICSGAFVAAAAGLLDGHRVTTHWASAGTLAERFPTVEVDPEPIYVADGRVWSSAGVTAGIDLALAVVEADHDADTAQVVARWLVMFLRRPGGQTQFATPVWSERAEHPPIRRAQDLIDAEPGADHRVGLLAAQVGMSARHFTRRFTDEVGASPAQYVAAVRVEAARRDLETTSETVVAIARRHGFGTAETMRRTFTRRLGVSPDDYRRRFARTRS